MHRNAIRVPSNVAMAAVLLTVGCATASKDIAPTYISPMQYQAYDCDQIAAEIARVQARVQQIGGRLDEAASNDKKITGVGLILFWPAFFALGGTKEQEAEFARLKGEYDALESAAIAKRCLQGLQQPTQTAPAATGQS